MNAYCKYAAPLRRILSSHSLTDHAGMALSSGCITGEPGNLKLDNLALSELKLVLDRFKDMPPNWHNTTLLGYYYSCESLLTLRSHVVNQDWKRVEEFVNLASKPDRISIKTISPDAIPEFQLSRRHAVYSRCCDM